MACNTSSSYTLNYPWIAPGVNETPGTTRTFVEWTVVLGLPGSILCQYMLDYPGWFTEVVVVPPPSGVVISFQGYDVGAIPRQGVVTAQASDYYTDQIDVSPSTTIPGANLHDQLEWLKLNVIGAQSWLEVVDTILSAPPGLPPAAGYRVLVTAGATGLFAGQDHNIAVSDGLGGYSFVATSDGDTVCAIPNPGNVYHKVAGAFTMYSYGNWQVKASAADTTPGWLYDKLDIPGFAKAIINPGANEVLRFTPSGGGGGGGAFPVSVYRDTAGTLVIPASGAWVDVPFATPDLTSAAVNQAGVDFIFQEAGTFFVGVEVTVASGFSRTKQAARVMMSLDLGVSYAAVPYMETEVFTPNTFNDEQTIVIGSRPIIALVNDRIKVQVACSSGTLDGTLAGSKTNIVIWRMEAAGGVGGGVTDHGALTGLADDDHTQYHNDARGDARYPHLSGSYADPTWLTSLAWAKLTGVPVSFAPSAHTHVSADITDASEGGMGAADGGKLVKFGGDGELKATAASGAIGAALEALDNYGATITSQEYIAARIRSLDPTDTFDIARFENQYGNGLQILNDGALKWLGGGEVDTRTNLGLGTAAVEDAATTSTADAVVKALGTGKIDTTFLPDSILGQLEYQGGWTGSTNTPAIPAAATGNKGHYYITTVAVAAGHGYANIPNVDYQVGDWLVSNGTTWDKVDNTDAVASVHGRLGAVVAANGDYNAGQITNTPAGNIAAVTVQAAINELDNEKQPLEPTLTALAAITTSAGLIEQTTPDVFLIRRIGVASATDIPTRADADARYQALDADLTAIAGLAPTNDDIIQRKAGAWVNRTLAQLLTDLNLGALYAALSHTHAAGDITSGTMATARLGSGTADGTTFLRGDNTWATPAGGVTDKASAFIDVIGSQIGTNATWSNMPAADTWLLGTTTNRPNYPMDLTRYTQARITVQMSSTAGFAGSTVMLRYKATAGNNVADYIIAGTTEIAATIDTASATTDSGWIDLVAGAKADVWVGVVGTGGNGAVDPVFQKVVIEFR